MLTEEHASSGMNAVKTTFDYNARDWISRVTLDMGLDPDLVTEYTYLRTGQLKTSKDPNGHTTTMDYDTRGRLTGIVYPGTVLPTVEFHYDPLDRLTQTVDPEGNDTLYEYNYLSQLLSITEPMAGVAGRPVTNFEYDAAGNLIRVVDAEQRETIFTYDPTLTLLTGATRPQPDGTGLPAPMTTFSHDNLGRVERIDRLLDNHVEFTYDGVDRVLLTTETADDGSLARGSQVTYALTGGIATVSNSLNQVTTYDYDDWGRLTKFTPSDPDATVSGDEPSFDYEYDGLSRLTKEINPYGWETLYDYDNASRATAMHRPSPAAPLISSTTSWTYGYDRNGNLTSVTDPEARLTEYRYDERNRLTDIDQPDADGTGRPNWHYTYDRNSNLTGITDPLGRTTTAGYDGLDRLVQILQPNPAPGQAQPSTILDYDRLGNLTQVTLSGGLAGSRQVNYEYDDHLQLEKVLQPDPDPIDGDPTRPETQFGYDTMGRLLTVTDPLQRTTTYGYDKLSRQTTVTSPDPDGVAASGHDSLVTTFGYDLGDRLISVTPPGLEATTYEYDDLNRLLKTTQPDPDGAAPTGGPHVAPVTEYTYDLLSRVTTQTLPQVDDADPGSRPVYAYEYDGLSRLTEVTAPDPDPLDPTDAALVTAFEYDLVGNRTKVTQDPDGTPLVTEYVYDALNRLTRIDENGYMNGWTEFTYDKVGNLTQLRDARNKTTSYTYDGLDRLTSETVSGVAGSRDYEYDAAGNLVKYTDRLGRETQYAWDDLSRLTSETWTGAGHVATWSYDLAGQVQEVQDPHSGYSFAYDNVGRVTQVDNSTPTFTPDVHSVIDYVFSSSHGLLESTDVTVDTRATSGPVLDHNYQYGYDGLGRMTTITHTPQAMDPKTAYLDYNALNQLTTIQRGQWEDTGAGAPMTHHFVADTTLSYDLAGRLTDIDHAAHADVTGDAAISYSMNHDVYGRLTDLTASSTTAEHVYSRNSTYAYDTRDQLTNEITAITSDVGGGGTGGSPVTTQLSQSFSYGLHGNRQQVSRTETVSTIA